MIPSLEFLKSIFDSITEHIAVIDESGAIRYVNKSWVTFGHDNGCTLSHGWEEIDYLEACYKAAQAGDELAGLAVEGIRRVINHESDNFYLEYPCHGTDEKRWFIMIVTPFSSGGARYFVLSHQNITNRKLAEEKLLELSRIDELTQLNNRRYFDEKLQEEWSRSMRMHTPLTLALIDLDHFKILNDTYGHLAGDECLAKIGALLQASVKRPGDVCARYGGEEFVILFGNTTVEKSLMIFQSLMGAIEELGIPNENAPTKPIVTASIGLAALCPDSKTEPKQLVELADKNLYAAKNSGRNQIVY